MKYPLLINVIPQLDSLAKENVKNKKCFTDIKYKQAYIEFSNRIKNINISAECKVVGVYDSTHPDHVGILVHDVSTDFAFYLLAHKSDPRFSSLVELDKNEIVLIDVPDLVGQTINFFNENDPVVFERIQNAPQDKKSNHKYNKSPIRYLMPLVPIEPNAERWQISRSGMHNSYELKELFKDMLHDLIEVKNFDIEVKSKSNNKTTGHSPNLKESNKTSSCFIATAATGSYEHPMVKDLRVFRDQILLSSQIGSAFVNWYYTKSPRIAAYIGKNKISRFLTRNFFVRPLAFIARFLTNV
jgi:hypothetical protein